MILRCAYSTDLDDAFMFWALASGRLDARDWNFAAVQHERADTATLNQWAREGRFDVVAVSVALWPSLAKDWLMLPHGGSVGRGYGPVVVAKKPLSLDGATVGVPGETTTCARLVAQAAPGARRVCVPSAPLSLAFDALDSGSVDACALIHEGRLLYEQRGLHLILDLGAWWTSTRALPLPLGGNVIRRGLGGDAIARATDMLGASIDFALQHREQFLDEVDGDRGLSRAQADAYLRLYANEDTRDWGDDGRAALAALVGPVEFAA